MACLGQKGHEELLLSSPDRAADVPSCFLRRSTFSTRNIANGRRLPLPPIGGGHLDFGEFHPFTISSLLCPFLPLDLNRRLVCKKRSGEHAVSVQDSEANVRETELLSSLI